jgi:hypothetical protein
MFSIIEGHYNEVTLKNNTRQISSIKIDEPMNSVHNTFHYAEMTCDMAFILQKFLVGDCVSLPNVSETLFFSNSPIIRNHKPIDQLNGLAKKCHHKRRYIWKSPLRRMHGGQLTSDPCFY